MILVVTEDLQLNYDCLNGHRKVKKMVGKFNATTVNKLVNTDGMIVDASDIYIEGICRIWTARVTNAGD